MNGAMVLVGPPASGKSTFAKEIIATGFVTGYPFIEVNRDNIRFSEISPGGDWTTYQHTKENEKYVTREWNRQLNRCIVEKSNIVLSDTNLNIDRLIPILSKLSSWEYLIHIYIFDLPMEVCIERDKNRGNMSVGEKVVRTFYEKLEDFKSQRHRLDYPVTYIQAKES